MLTLAASLLILTLSGLHKIQADDDFIPDCPATSDEWVRHPTNCSRFYRCVFGSPIEYAPCASGLRFSLIVKNCVPADSPSDDCPVEVRCKENPTAIFAHPDYCQLYYNCSNDAEPVWRSPFDKYMEECPYPQLFNRVTSRCEDYNDVTCGDRVEVVNACEYFRQFCPSSCYPCNLIYPSCEGLPDGTNAFAQKEWTPNYITCKDNRTISTDQCPFNTTLNITAIFSPDRGECVSLYEIPAEHYGKPLNCAQKADGRYPDDVTSRPDLYFRCDGGQLAEIAVCPSGEQFDEDSQGCVQS